MDGRSAAADGPGRAHPAHPFTDLPARRTPVRPSGERGAPSTACGRPGRAVRQVGRDRVAGPATDGESPARHGTVMVVRALAGLSPASGAYPVVPADAPLW
ncbi:hypothetical protein [Streptomyces sp. S.PNR 29]|uniref:hypothetical protein n=1 Tax=Streptomyces sp. S.PNR 29 TaxID=2973805 RepID=UPI0025AFAEE0|nr:hypothetical protein [Streptomyces sp. S.PNR 29]MDN0198266.1 hypothetical protein [Streptomyces sp. S.PNR 29]